MKLTVFTPTYNREKLLPRVYESLCAQTDRDFQWLIVDDGSTDGTEKLVNRWINDGPLSIRYYKQKNGGKMRAHNTGVKLTETELFVCLDSDDSFTSTAVSDILMKWSEVADKRDCGGIVAHKGADEEHTLYDAVMPDISFSTLQGLYRQGFKGETTLVFKTELLKRHLFPEIPGEKYVPEDVVYDEIDRECVLAVLPKILTVCELVESGLTDRVAALREENPTGWYLYYVNRSKNTPWSPLKLKYISHYLRFRGVADREVRDREFLPAGLALLGVPGALALIFAGKR